MARPRKSEASREHLILLGIQLFTAQGFHGTGLKQILDQASVPKGSFYNFFSSKENFAAQAVRAYTDHLLAFCQNINTEDPVRRLLDIHRQLLKLIEAQDRPFGCLLGTMASEIGGVSGELQVAVQEGFDGWIKLYAGIFTQAQRSGQITSDIDAMRLAHLFIDLWQGGLVRYQFTNNGTALVESLETLLLRALKPKK